MSYKVEMRTDVFNLLFLASARPDRRAWVGPENEYQVNCFDDNRVLDTVDLIYCPSKKCPILMPINNTITVVNFGFDNNKARYNCISGGSSVTIVFGVIAAPRSLSIYSSVSEATTDLSEAKNKQVLEVYNVATCVADYSYPTPELIWKGRV